MPSPSMSSLIEKHSWHSNQRSQGFIYGFFGLDEGSWTSQQHERWRGGELILCMCVILLGMDVFNLSREMFALLFFCLICFFVAT